MRKWNLKGKLKLNLKEIQILSIVVAVWGAFLCISGISMSLNKRVITKTKYSLDVSTKEISQVQAKKNEIILKNIEIDEGTPISSNIRDYLENVDQVGDALLKQLQEGLDTSAVNVNQPGTYMYIINYKKKRYQGSIKVNAKETPKIVITLKAKKLPTTGTLSRNIKDYVYENENITEDIYKNMILDLEEVAAHMGIPGRYKYKVIYNDTTYYGDFDIVEPVSTGNSEIICQTDEEGNNVCKCNDPYKEYDATTNSCKDKKPETPTE